MALWQYTPDLDSAALSVVMFTILFGLHVYQFVKTRNKLCIFFLFGGFHEVVGYIIRAIGHSHLTSRFLYVAQFAVILLTPLAFSVATHRIQAAVMIMVDRGNQAPVSPSLMRKLLLWGHFLTSIVMGVAVSMIGVPVQVGVAFDIILGALGFQIFIFAFSITTCAIWHSRLLKYPTVESKMLERKMSLYAKMLYGSSVLITVRNMGQLVEIATGSGGFLQTNEWPFYLYDGLLMVGVMVIALKWYTADFQGQQRRGIVELEDGREE